MPALFAGALLQYGWNAWSVPPLTGYDEGAHAGYILTLVDEGRLPHPMEGWATFHPPLYYLLASALWPGLEPWGPRALVAGLRAPGAAAVLAAGGVAYRLVVASGAGWIAAWVCAALVLFVPCSQLAAVMIGNEALAFGLGALALLPLLALQRDPRSARAAAAAGGLAGLALATKYTGAFVALACAVPFLRRDFDRAMARALAAGALAGLAVTAPVYARNVALAGTPLPILREHEPTRSQEARNVLRPRRLADYLWVDPECLLRPSIYHVRGESTSELRRNRAMTRVWGLAYASIWYDAFAHRIPVAYHRDRVLAGPLLAVLGLVPTGLVLLGFGLALAEAVRRRLRSGDAPLVAVWLVGLAMFVAFTGWAPSLLAVKGSYLLPLAVPGAVFFARGLGRIGPDLQRWALGVSAAAALAAAAVFTADLVFPSPPVERMARVWRIIGAALPDSHIAEAVERLTRGR